MGTSSVDAVSDAEECTTDDAVSHAASEWAILAAVEAEQQQREQSCPLCGVRIAPDEATALVRVEFDSGRVVQERVHEHCVSDLLRPLL
jgi:hypothetical protein